MFKTMSLKSSKITDNVKLGKMIGNEIDGVTVEDLPTIKFYSPNGIEVLPTRFLDEEVGGGIDDIRKCIYYVE